MLLQQQCIPVNIYLTNISHVVVSKGVIFFTYKKETNFDTAENGEKRVKHCERSKMAKSEIRVDKI